MCVEDQAIANLRIHIRGNHLTLGEEVPRRFPRILAGENPPPLESSRSGRLELATWLTGRDHPLTARVMVNRLWLWHFGEGLVGSPDNFGRLGDRPIKSRPARLAVAALHRLGLVDQGDAPIDHAFSTLSDEHPLRFGRCPC